jgi:hypothetical protein
LSEAFHSPWAEWHASEISVIYRRTFGLNAARWKAFIAAPDAAPRPLPHLELLLKESGFFDDGPSQ